MLSAALFECTGSRRIYGNLLDLVTFVHVVTFEIRCKYGRLLTITMHSIEIEGDASAYIHTDASVFAYRCTL